jgi:transposase-like protein
MIMSDDVPFKFSGIVEMDETYIGGRWVNKPAWIRRSQKAKKGHGTSKQAIFGILNRNTECVRVFLVPDLKERTLYPIITSLLVSGTKVYTDGYSIYKPMKRYFKRHHTVDHAHGEYARGDIHTNTIESFWAYLKKNLSVIGGIRPEYFNLFVGEFVWRYNHRKLNREEQTELLMKKLVED